MMVLDRFYQFLGQRVSKPKSMIYVSRNVDASLTSRLESISGMRSSTDLGQYLGIHVLHKEVTKATFDDLLMKSNNRLAGWKVTLSKAVLSNISLYAMNYVQLLESTCEALDKIIRAFIWGNHSSWRRPHFGSLRGGFSMVTQSKLRSDCSYSWKSILQALNGVIKKGKSWNLGDGHSIRFWEDSWLDDGPLIDKAITPIDPTLLNKKVANFWMDSSGYENYLILPSLLARSYAWLLLLCIIVRIEDNHIIDLFCVAWHVSVSERIRYFLCLGIHGKLMANAERVR
ncbi:LOW QUALITY PROTEIN: hypothetical protein V2J09_000464 [Rumex salicifolius]